MVAVRTAEDAADWVSQFFVWTDEEVLTGGLGDSRARIDIDGVSHVVAANHGWQLSDPREHDRFTALAGPFGWHDGGRSTWTDGSVSVPAERELEVDGERFLVSVRGGTTEVTWLTGPNPATGSPSSLASSGTTQPDELAAVNARLRRTTSGCATSCGPSWPTSTPRPGTCATTEPDRADGATR